MSDGARCFYCRKVPCQCANAVGEHKTASLSEQVERLRAALEPIVAMLKVEYNSGLVHLELDGVPIARPIEQDVRDKLGTLYTLLYNAEVALMEVRPK